MATTEVADIITLADCIKEANVYGVKVPGTFHYTFSLCSSATSAANKVMWTPRKLHFLNTPSKQTSPNTVMRVVVHTDVKYYTHTTSLCKLNARAADLRDEIMSKIDT